MIWLARLLRRLADRIDDPDAVAARELQRIRQTRDAVKRDHDTYVDEIMAMQREREAETEPNTESKRLIVGIGRLGGAPVLTTQLAHLGHL